MRRGDDIERAERRLRAAGFVRDDAHHALRHRLPPPPRTTYWFLPDTDWHATVGARFRQVILYNRPHGRTQRLYPFGPEGDAALDAALARLPRLPRRMPWDEPASPDA